MVGFFVVWVEVFRPGWRLQIRLGLVVLVCLCAALLAVFLWWGFSFTTLLFMALEEAVPVGLVLALVVLMVYGASVFDDRRVKRRLRRLMASGGGGGLACETPGEMIAREIREMSLSRCRDLPGRFVSETNSEFPEAIVLHCGDRFGPGTMVRPVKEPLSCNVPFEPLPLGRDPERTRTLLDNFVWKYPNAGCTNAGGSGVGQHFSASRAASVFSLPGTLGAAGGMLLLVLLTGDLTKLYLVGCVAGPSFAYHIGRLILS